MHGDSSKQWLVDTKCSLWTAVKISRALAGPGKGPCHTSITPPLQCHHAPGSQRLESAGMSVLLSLYSRSLAPSSIPKFHHIKGLNLVLSIRQIPNTNSHRATASGKQPKPKAAVTWDNYLTKRIRSQPAAVLRTSAHTVCRLPCPPESAVSLVQPQTRPNTGSDPLRSFWVWKAWKMTKRVSEGPV